MGHLELDEHRVVSNHNFKSDQDLGLADVVILPFKFDTGISDGLVQKELHWATSTAPSRALTCYSNPRYSTLTTTGVKSLVTAVWTWPMKEAANGGIVKQSE